MTLTGLTQQRIRQSSPDRLEQQIRAWASDLRYLAAMFLASRLVLTAIGLIARHLLPANVEGKPASLSSYPWLDIWGVWDSFWYMDIVQNGYSMASRLSYLPEQTNLAFFPLYPLLVKLLGNVLGDRYFLAGLLISNGCLLLACYLLYQLVRLEHGRKIARRAVKYLFLFPVSFILSGFFTESLYLCLTLLCFYLARQRHWWLAGICGAALSATRTLGVLIAIPLAFEYLRSRRFKLRNIRWNGLFLLLVPLGLAAFCAYSYQITGDFLFFKTNQAAWGREIVNPILALGQAISGAIAEHSVKKLLEVTFCLAALGVLIRFYREIGWSYWLFGMYSIIVPLSAGVASMPRFTLPIFPLYIGLALMGRQKWGDRAITVTFITMQTGLMLLWCTGQGLVI